MFKSSRKFGLGILLSVFVFVFANTGLAFTQLGEVPISHPGLGSGGITGGISSTAAEIALTGVRTANEGCQKAEEVFRGADHAREIAFGGLSLIGGSTAEVASIETKVQAIEGFLRCREQVKTSLGLVSSPNLYIGQAKQRLEEEINLSAQTLLARKDELQTQARIAKRGLWKGIMMTVLLNSTKTIASDLANRLSNKFKVSDFMGYADAVAGRVYTTQLIQNNSRDNADMLIYRSLLDTSMVEGSLSPAVRLRADSALGYDLNKLDYDDPDFYLKMARVGASDANPFMVNVAMVDEAYQMESKGRQSALAEIQQSNGLKAPRTCSGNLAQQQAIDLEYKATNKELADRTKLLADLKNYQQSMKNFTTAEAQRVDADVEKAQRDYDSAKAKLSALPKKYESPVLTICEEIVSPASSIDKGIEAAFTEVSRGMGDYKTENLPFFMTFISDIASKIGTSLIFGGNVGNAVLTESGNINKAIGTGLAFAADANARTNLESGVIFNSEKSKNFPDAYFLNWEVVNVKDAAYVQIKTIKGTGNTVLNQKLALAGTTEIRTTQDSTFELVVFDSNGKKLVNVYTEVKVGISANPYLSGSAPLILGASRSAAPLVQLRGP